MNDMVPLKLIFDAAEKEMKDVGLSRGTTLCYWNVFHKISAYCELKRVVSYSSEIGDLFLNEYLNQTKDQGRSIKDYLKRTIRYLNSYCETGVFGFGTILKRGYKTPDSDNFIDLLADYENWASDTCKLKKSSILSYREGIVQALCYFESIGITKIDDIKITHLPALLAHLREGRSDVTFANEISHLRSFSLFLKRDDLFFFFKFVKVKCHKHIVPTLTSEEHNMLLSFLRTGNICYRDKGIVLLAVYTGMRSCDIRTLKLSDVDWNNDYFSFIQMKTGNPIKLPMLTEPWNAIHDYIAHERTKCCLPEVFLVDTKAPARPLSSSAVKDIIERTCMAAGIDLGNRPHGTRLTRHNAGSLLHRENVSQSVIATILGHSDIEVTSVYISTDAEKLRECCLPFLTEMKVVDV